MSILKNLKCVNSMNTSYYIDCFISFDDDNYDSFPNEFRSFY